MQEERINTLMDCLFNLVGSFNTVLDRLDTLTDRHEELLLKNDEVYTKMGKEFMRKMIEIQVNLETEKNNKGKKL